jgi:hypothetical protein
MFAVNKHIIIATGLVAVIAFACIDPTSPEWLIHCPFKILTGLQCPGCGDQRALHALLCGHPLEAVSYNLFLIVALPYLIAFAATSYLPTARLFHWLRSKTTVKLFLVTVAAWMVIRNILKI